MKGKKIPEMPEFFLINKKQLTRQNRNEDRHHFYSQSLFVDFATTKNKLSGSRRADHDQMYAFAL